MFFGMIPKNASAFTRPHAGTDASEEAEGEEGNEAPAFQDLDVGHEFGGLGRRGGCRRALLAADAVVRNLGHRILADPAALKAELEERRENAAPVVVGLQRRVPEAAKTNQGFRGWAQPRRCFRNGGGSVSAPGA